MEGVESIVRGDLKPGSHDIVELLGQRGEVFGFWGRDDRKRSRDTRRDRAVEFPQGRARHSGERRQRREEKAKESVGGDKDKTRRTWYERVCNDNE